jgi:uncharacterized protein (DUF1778 family)
LEEVVRTSARFDLTLDSNDKQVLSQAAAISGQTLASFVREAALSRSREIIEQQTRITMSRSDFAALTSALNSVFTPNTALQGALEAAKGVGHE